MNLTKFLLLDCGIIILGIPLLLLFHGNKTKASLLEKVYGANNLNATYNSLPSQQKLLELEGLFFLVTLMEIKFQKILF